MFHTTKGTIHLLLALLGIGLCGAIPAAAQDQPAATQAKTVPSGFSVAGEWDYSASVTGHKEGKQTLWTNKDAATAIWNPEIPSVAPVRISLHKAVHPGSGDPNVRVDIIHAGTTDTLYLDFAQGESAWLELGTFDFTAQGSEYVRVTKITPLVNTRVSAAKFEILEHGKENMIWQTLILDELNAVDYDALKIVNFDDMKDHWAEADAESMVEQGFLKPAGENRFNGDGAFTVPDLAAALAALMTQPEDQIAGVVRGTVRSKADSLTPIEFARVLAVAVRLSGKNLDWAAGNAPAPTEGVSGADRETIQFLANLQIILAPEDKAFTPGKPVTRAQAAVLLNRLRRQVLRAGPPAGSQWELTFQDEFDGQELDWTQWESHNGPSRASFSRWKENTAVGNGILRLLTKKEERVEGVPWTSAFIWTKFRQQYGYWEASYRYGAAPGLNNAFWTVTRGEVKDPEQVFEIDVNEGHHPNRINMTVHQNPADSQSHRATFDLSRDFHTYAVEWTPEEIVFYSDGQELSRQKNRQAHSPTPIMFSTAVLQWAGPITDALDGTSMDVDWVRVYQRKK
ncbi:family 16 glycosylhydrolase [bacterium]|nr:family 16 glycosylhydrolase [bacterium]